MKYSDTLGRLTPKQLLAGGAALLAIALLLESRSLPSFGTKAGEVCQTVANGDRKLTRTQIAKLLSIEQGAAKGKVRDLLKEPYCTLPDAQIRSDTPAERDVYLVEADDFVQFQPKTQLVVLYEGDQYAGFRFWVH
ncbi:hypothetical protein [Myxacorys almedinensis]|uniref:Uncharacterized protein n=1 Tax=Myxacorys almedinensis A TaxID=2690445 RepID=A0A8J7Z283_9CYAN|nr:hypothetical protein [Myxacorys almedinensis]NDJ19032.1 hypothetical protein [Myxacorys almedinensis A]